MSDELNEIISDEVPGTEVNFPAQTRAMTDAEIAEIERKLQSGEMNINDLNEPPSPPAKKEPEAKQEETPEPEPEPGKEPEAAGTFDEASFLSKRWPTLQKTYQAKAVEEILDNMEKGYSGMRTALNENAELKRILKQNGFETVKDFTEAMKSVKDNPVTDISKKPDDSILKPIDDYYAPLIEQAKEEDERELLAMDPEDRRGYQRKSDILKWQRDKDRKIAEATYKINNGGEEKVKLIARAMDLANREVIARLEFSELPGETKKLWSAKKEDLFRYLRENPAELLTDNPLQAAMNALKDENDTLLSARNEQTDKEANEKIAALKKRLANQYGGGASMTPSGKPGEIIPPKPPDKHSSDYEKQKRKYEDDMQEYYRKLDEKTARLQAAGGLI